MKKLFILLAGICLFILGVYTAKYYFLGNEIAPEEKSTVLLEKIKTVCKLITVEGHFSEIYDYKDYYGYDFSPFRKKALIRVKAKVSVGYDFSNMKIESIPNLKTIRISQLPEPEILSIDHDLDYYDLQEGTFNSFTAKDLSNLNEKAKAFIEKQAKASDLFTSAGQQGTQLMDLIKFTVESADWTLEVQSRSPSGILDSLMN